MEDDASQLKLVKNISSPREFCMVGNLSQALVRFMRSVADALSGPRIKFLI
jgi:hypothetical protein